MYYLFTFIILLLQPSFSIGAFFNSNDLSGQTSNCIQSTEQLASQYPQLEACFDNSNLYFSTLSQVCNSNCLPAATQASKHISLNCRKIPSANTRSALTSESTDSADSVNASDAMAGNDKTAVYMSWADPIVNQAACTKVTYQNNDIYCLDRLFQANQFLNMLDFTPIPNGLTKNQFVKNSICDSCTKLMFTRVGRYKNLPFLYYWSFTNVDQLWNGLQSYCGY